MSLISCPKKPANYRTVEPKPRIWRVERDKQLYLPGPQSHQSRPHHLSVSIHQSHKVHIVNTSYAGSGDHLHTWTLFSQISNKLSCINTSRTLAICGDSTTAHKRLVLRRERRCIGNVGRQPRTHIPPDWSQIVCCRRGGSRQYVRCAAELVVSKSTHHRCEVFESQ